MTQTSMTTVRMTGVSKAYNQTTIVDNVDLEVGAGEFFSILGPSGCGKTTTLRMLAGFLTPDEGTIELQGVDVTAVPPYRRDVNTVFQSYALFGHLNVADNVAFGLKRKRVGKSEIRRRVGEALDMVSLIDRAGSKPADLSGGQRQRVALARALINMPKLLLLDEPLGALDLQLRRQMQVELKRIQREVGITFIYVTHDQEEALSMSDRIAVMKEGRLEQIGNPREIYDRPATAYIAKFIGTSNVLSAQSTGGDVLLDDGTRIARVTVADDPVTAVSIRPEKLAINAPNATGPRLGGTVQDVSYLGVTTHYQVDIAGGMHLSVVEANHGGARHDLPSVGDQIEVSWHEEDAVLLRN